MTAAEILIGTQGWQYQEWVGPFYPPGTAPPRMLEYYARAFRTAEIDATFYAVPADKTVAGWQEQVPAAFRFAAKIPQQITHELRLVNVREPLERFVERMRGLDSRLGAYLVQLSPDFAPTPLNHEALVVFLDLLPVDSRWAVEFRDPRWLEPPLLERFRERNVAIVLADSRWVPRDVTLGLAHEPTANFAYVRWMGPDRRISDFSRIRVDREEELAEWAAALSRLASRVRTVFGYFNNHWQGHSPASARRLQRLLGQRPVDPAALREQAELF